mgnify:CR=1 FL=1
MTKKKVIKNIIIYFNDGRYMEEEIDGKERILVEDLEVQQLRIIRKYEGFTNIIHIPLFNVKYYEIIEVKE